MKVHNDPLYTILLAVTMVSLVIFSAEVQDQTTASSIEKIEKSKSPASENLVQMQQDSVVVPALFKVRKLRSHHLGVDVASVHFSAS